MEKHGKQLNLKLRKQEKPNTRTLMQQVITIAVMSVICYTTTTATTAAPTSTTALTATNGQTTKLEQEQDDYMEVDKCTESDLDF